MDVTMLLALALGSPTCPPVATTAMDCMCGAGWPLAPPVTVVRAYSPPTVPWGAGHRGVDLAAKAGAPVYAVAAGRVSFAGAVGGRGVVAVAHPGALRTTYVPVLAAVPVGTQVRAGSRLGTVQSSAHCAATCLHWGLLSGPDYLDPLSVFCGPRVRLYPLWGNESLPPAPARAAPSRSTAAGPGRWEPTSAQAHTLTGAGLGALATIALALLPRTLLRHRRSRRLPREVINLALERQRRRAMDPSGP